MNDETPQPQARIWRTVKDAAKNRAKCGPKLIYREIRAGRLRAARIGGRRDYRTCDEWIDQWLEACAKPVEARRRDTPSRKQKRVAV